MRKVLTCRMATVFTLLAAAVAQEVVTVAGFCRGSLSMASGVVSIGLLISTAGFHFLPASGQAKVKADVRTGVADNRYCSSQNVPNFGGSDGPASTPKTCFNTARANTPSPGKVWNIPNGAALSTVLASVKCGDVVQLVEGGTYSFTNLTLPAKTCDDRHWITIETAGLSQLPVEGVRITPCFAGVASLPGRSYQCVAPRNVMAKLVIKGSNGYIANGAADHIRFIGIEFTRQAGTGIVYNLFNGGTGEKIIFDQCWLHGDDDSSGDETTRGIFLGLSDYVAVIDSFFTDFKCIAGIGTCQDSQAINGGIGTPNGTWGTYKVVNNFIEAAGENILIGGGEASTAPTDFEIRRNYFFKPLTWDPTCTNPAACGGVLYDGGAKGHPLVVKNCFELKNGRRVFLEGDVFENSWGGFTQVGNCVTLTPKSQSNLCPKCLVTDIILRYSTIHNVCQAFQIFNAPSDSGGWAAGGNSYSIHDVIADKLYDSSLYGCGNGLNQLSTAVSAPEANLLHDISINHITQVSSQQVGSSFMFMGGPITAKQFNLTLTNSIFPGQQWGIHSVGGSSNQCAYQQSGSVGVLQACWKPIRFNHNLVAGGGDWGSGNKAVPNQTDIGYIDLPNRNYRLLPKSPGHAAGTDGKDLGADISAVNSAIEGVR
jgi:hypothetical protein